MEKDYNINFVPYNSEYLIISFGEDIFNDMVRGGIIQYSKNLYENNLIFLGSTLLVSSKLNLNNEFKVSVNELKEVYRIINNYCGKKKKELKQDKIKEFKEKLLDCLYEFYPGGDFNDVEVKIDRDIIKILINYRYVIYFISDNRLQVPLECNVDLEDIEGIREDFIKLQNNIKNLIGGYRCYLM